MPLTIDRFKPVERGGIATFSVKFDGGPMDGTVINDCRAVKSRDGGWFVTAPQRSYEKNGKTEYFGIVKLGKSLEEAVRNAVKPQVEPLLSPRTATPADAYEDDIPF